MDIYSYLRKDHRKVSDLMEKVISSRVWTKRKDLFEEIKHELLIHAETEEKTFYAALENAEETEEKIDHAEEEHAEIREYIEKLSKISAQSEKWIEQFGEFKHAVEHHVEEEEGDIFKKAKKLLSKEEAIQLAEDMDKLKKQKLRSDKAA